MQKSLYGSLGLPQKIVFKIIYASHSHENPQLTIYSCTLIQGSVKGLNNYALAEKAVGCHSSHSGLMRDAMSGFLYGVKNIGGPSGVLGVGPRG